MTANGSCAVWQLIHMLPKMIKLECAATKWWSSYLLRKMHEFRGSDRDIGGIIGGNIVC